MARINLLPWREEARRERQRQFLYSLMGTWVLGAILVLIVGMFFDQHQPESRSQQVDKRVGSRGAEQKKR
jgi:type IV pilus assembly protein PilN